jgi:ribosomal-protein-alanine N-acetyltransferase
VTAASDVERAALQRACADQAAELAWLHGQLFAQPWDEVSWRRLLDEPGSASFLARVGAPPQTAGLILGRQVADEAEILTLGVGQCHRRRGIARRLVEAFAHAAKGAGAKRLFLEVGRQNEAAAAFYAGLGFRRVGLRKGYYERAGQRSEDALVLALPL